MFSPSNENRRETIMIKKTLLGAAVAALSLASFDASAFAKGGGGGGHGGGGPHHVRGGVVFVPVTPDYSCGYYTKSGHWVPRLCN